MPKPLLPISPMVMPSVLAGQKNGELPAHLLHPTGIPGLLMVKPAQRAMTAMTLVMMSELGPDLEMRTVGGYRSLRTQWNIFGGPQKRYEPCSYAEWLVASAYGRGKVWEYQDRVAVAAALNVAIPDSTYWRKIKRADGSYPATAARPGSSNHGWALAADLAEEYDEDDAADAIRSKTVLWLIAHAIEYGYSAETQEENWHWRYVAGDAIPQRVLDVEAYLAGHPPVTPPPVVTPPVVVPPVAPPVVPPVAPPIVVPPVVTPTTPPASETLMNTLYHIVDKPGTLPDATGTTRLATAVFMGIADAKGNCLEVRWTGDTTNERTALAAHQAAGIANAGIGWGQLRNMALKGRTPVGDTLHVWTGSEFAVCLD